MFVNLQKNSRKNSRIVGLLALVAIAVPFLIVVGLAAFQVHAKDVSYQLNIIDSPDLGAQCAVLNVDGHIAQSCFLKAGQICDNNTVTVGPLDEFGTTGYWVKLDRRSSCTSKIRIGVPDVLCHILLPDVGEPSISCVVI